VEFLTELGAFIENHSALVTGIFILITLISLTWKFGLAAGKNLGKLLSWSIEKKDELLQKLQRKITKIANDAVQGQFNSLDKKINRLRGRIKQVEAQLAANTEVWDEHEDLHIDLLEQIEELRNKPTGLSGLPGLLGASSVAPSPPDPILLATLSNIICENCLNPKEMFHSCLCKSCGEPYRAKDSIVPHICSK